jgi:hypothetical protein
MSNGRARPHFDSTSAQPQFADRFNSLFHCLQQRAGSISIMRAGLPSQKYLLLLTLNIRQIPLARHPIQGYSGIPEETFFSTCSFL